MARTPTSSWPPVPLDQISLMRAVAADFPLEDKQLAYEPKYDGVRVKTLILPGTRPDGVRIWSRQGNSLTQQFPDLVTELDRFRRTLAAPVVTDGEIVAVDGGG